MKIKVLTTILCLISLPVALAQVNFTSSNLPIIVINTHGQTIPDEPKIDADMGIIYNGVGLRNSLTDPFNNFNGKIGIELRGSTSQDLFPKSNTALKSGMPAEKALMRPCWGCRKRRLGAFCPL